MSDTLELMKHQYEFLADTESRYLALVGGFGCGKTFAFCLKTIFIAAENVGFNGAIMEPTGSQLYRVLIPDMKTALERCGVPYTYKASQALFVLHFAEGDTKVYCLAAENHDRMVGMNLAFFGIDECDKIRNKVVARAAWFQAIARLRSGKVFQGYTTSTPEGFQFLYEYFVSEPQEDPTITDRRLIKGKTKDNPHNAPGYIESMMANYPPQLIKAYLEGEFTNLESGQVYPNFDRFKNHTDKTLADFPGLPLHIGQDFNIGECSSVVHVLVNGNPIAVDEITKTYNTEALIRELRSRYGNRHITIYPDPAGNQGHTNASMSDLAMLQKAGFELKYTKAHPPIKDRVNAVNGMLCNSNGNRRYLINTRICKEFTKCLEQQAYKNGQPDKSSGTDHMLDAAGYFINMVFPIVARPTARIY